MKRPITQTVGYVLSVLLGLLFLFSAAGKLLGQQEAVEMLTKWGLGGERVMIGIGEAVSIVLFLIPRTFPLGLLLLSSYLGGAIVTHMQNGESYLAPSGFLILLWVAAELRRPFIVPALLGRTAPAAR